MQQFLAELPVRSPQTKSSKEESEELVRYIDKI